MFADEELDAAGEAAAVRRVHRELFARLAAEAAPHLEAGRQREWIDRLLSDQDNLRAALDPPPGGEPADVAGRLRLAADLWRFWVARGQFGEGFERLEALLAADPGDDGALRTRALHGAATLAHNLGRNACARELLEEARALCLAAGDEAALLQVDNNLAWVALEMTDLGEGEARSRDGLELARRRGDLRAQAVALNNLGFLAAYRERWDAAAEHHRASLELRGRIHDRRGEAFARINLAWAERERGELETAAELLAEAETRLEEMGDRILSIWAICHRAALRRARGERGPPIVTAAVLARAREVGNPSVVGELLLARSAEAAGGDDARRFAREAYEEFRGYGCPWGVGRGAARLAAVAEDASDGEAAVRWWREALTAAEAGGLACQAERAGRALSRLGVAP